MNLQNFVNNGMAAQKAVDKFQPKQVMSFSKHCNYCTGNKRIYKESGIPSVLQLLREAKGYIDSGDYKGNEVQSSLAKEIDKVLGK